MVYELPELSVHDDADPEKSANSYETIIKLPVVVADPNVAAIVVELEVSLTV